MLLQEALVCTYALILGRCAACMQVTYFVSFCADVDDVKFVINYDFPGAVEDYIHRLKPVISSSSSLLMSCEPTFLFLLSFLNIINKMCRIGRTGRKGNTGTAYTFFTQKNGKNAAQLINILKEANQVIRESFHFACCTNILTIRL